MFYSDNFIQNWLCEALLQSKFNPYHISSGCRIYPLKLRLKKPDLFQKINICKPDGNQKICCCERSTFLVFETSCPTALLRVLIFYECSKLRDSLKITIFWDKDRRWGHRLSTLSGKFQNFRNFENSKKKDFR